MRIKMIIFSMIMILTPFLVLEFLFKFLPVSHPPHILPVSSSDPVARVQPNLDYTFSLGWDFSIRTQKHSNNFGWVNAQDYDPDLRTPLFVVIGDSFVEANHVDSGKSSAELLHSWVSNKGRVYSIGLSGAPLSQYLVFAEYAKTNFHPNSMAVVIVGNDFDLSLLKYEAVPRFHHFKEVDGGLELHRIDYGLSVFKKALRKSSLFRYIIFNLHGKEILKGLFRGGPTSESQEYIGNVPRYVNDERMIDSMRAIDKFLDLLPSKAGLETNSILFVMDGMRPALYSQEMLKQAGDSYFAQMRQYFQQQARSLGYEVTDMQPIFMSQHQLDGSRFEFDSDGHWNEEGNRLAAQEVQKSAVFTHTFQ